MLAPTLSSRGRNLGDKVKKAPQREMHGIGMRSITQKSAQKVLGKEQRAQRRVGGEMDGRGELGGGGGWRVA
jgi:hypothetical protein